ncbi:hypothetical protein N9536_03870, partial [Flavobacteriaceae bacterium]|nr:hypothetical protein [Flavobacteriaceae bacterium]
QLLCKESIQKIAKSLVDELDIPLIEVLNFVTDLNKQLVIPNTIKHTEENSVVLEYEVPLSFAFENYYLINSKIIKVVFSTEFELSLIHPKFAHLETTATTDVDFLFEVFNNSKDTFLIVDGIFVGAWTHENIHYFQGKFCMKIIESIYQKKENEWMGVFHASAINYKEDALLILGDSGNGKSTSLALLQAQGFHCIADDFVPIDTNHKVVAFPAGISIKPKAVDVLISEYPSLKMAAEYYYERLNKTVRYLPPKNINYKKKFPCKALVFIKYDTSVELKVSKISNLEAFESLVPDSWISKVSENAASFLTWFSNLPCYQLTYSNNEMMYATIKSIFEEEL